MKKQFIALIARLNLTAKAKNADFTPDELKQIDAECQKEFKLSYVDTMKKIMEEKEEDITVAEEHKAVLSALFGENTNTDNGDGGESTNEDEGPKDPVQAVNKLKQTVATQKEQIEALGKKPEPSNPKRTEARPKVVPITGGAHTEKYLFGIEAPFFDMKKPWNAVAAHRRPLEVFAADKGFEANWDEYEADFKKEVSGYSKQLAARIAQLQGEGRLGSIKMQDIDFTGFDGTGWGETYIVRRMDALIAYIRTLNSFAGIFPVRYGVQNKEVMTNAFLTSFSQSYQGGRVFKGGSAVQPIEAEVFDLMFKHKFSNLKDLEKEYIGYLNTEGSDPMKWGWIEWLLSKIMEVLMNEWVERRILGCRVEPTKDKAGHHLHGSTGVIRKLLGWAWDEFRLQPFTDFASYSKTTILTYVEGFVEAVNQKLPSLKGLTLYMNEKHLPWYNAAYRKEYGLQQDFGGSKGTIMNYPDVNIQTVPGMGNLFFMWITIPKNIELLENAAGEMSKIGMQRDLEELMVFSYWKEGVNAILVGKKYATAAALAADNYQSQYIFMTDPTIELTANATTCDASKGMFFKTIANAAAAPVITDITNAVAGVVYRITCGDTTFASKTAKSGKFSLVDAWVPTAVGDFLEVYLYFNKDDATDASNNKFVEVKRKVTA